MTQIQSSVAPGGRHDDSTILRKHLLQDLERQWLDIWGLAGQLQGQARMQSDASGAGKDGASPQGASAAENSSGASGSPVLRAPTETLARIDTSNGNDGGRSSVSAGTRGAKSSEQKFSGVTTRQEHNRFDTAGAGVAVAAGGAPQAANVAGAGLAQPADQRAPAEHHGFAGGFMGLASGRASASQALAGSARRAAEGDSAAHTMIAVAATSVASAYAEATSNGLIASVSAPTRLAGPLAFSAAPRTANEDELADLVPVRRAIPVADPDGEPAAQHLMLRDLNEQEVLASLRDVHLGSAQSQTAAQELARALMQAGYARVQVVVNGYQQKLGETPIKDREDSAGSAELSVGLNPQPTSNTQSRHGN